MNTEKRIFDFCMWLVAAFTLLVILTSCNPYVSLYPTETATATSTPAAPMPTTMTPATPTPKTCTVSTNVPDGYLNIRTGPGTKYAVIGLLREGEPLVVLSRGAWLEVKAGDLSGWINGRYCR